MKFRTIASGSKGNCSIIMSSNTKLIVDLGISYLKLRKNLEKLGLGVEDFDGILITHCHDDHIRGLTSTLKKNNIFVYAPYDMTKELCQIIDKDKSANSCLAYMEGKIKNKNLITNGAIKSNWYYDQEPSIIKEMKEAYKIAQEYFTT